MELLKVCDLPVSAMFLDGIILGLIASLGLVVTRDLHASRDTARDTDTQPSACEGSAPHSPGPSRLHHLILLDNRRPE